MYSDGQIITDHKAFANWTNANGNKFSDRPNGDGTYTVYENKESETDKQNRVRGIRNTALKQTDKYMIVDFPINDEDRETMKQYRQYLRDYTKEKDWWESSPMTFDEYVANKAEPETAE